MARRSKGEDATSVQQEALSAVIPYVNELGLRDYRPHLEGAAPIDALWLRRWPWLVLLVCLVGLLLRVLR